MKSFLIVCFLALSIPALLSAQLPGTLMKMRKIPGNGHAEMRWQNPGNSMALMSGYKNAKNLPNGVQKSNSNIQTLLKLDSIVIPQTEKHYYEYDTDGKTLSHILYLWDSVPSGWRGWMQSEETDYYYDEARNLSKVLDWKWDYELQKWLRVEKQEFAYDAHGNKTLDSHFYWNESSSRWVMDDKTEWEYDASDRMTLHVNYTFLLEAESLAPLEKYINDYDDKGRLWIEWEYGWNGNQNQWNEFPSKTVHTYNQQENPSSIVTYTWDPHDTVWKTYIAYDYNYGEGSIVETCWIWNQELQALEKFSIEEQYFDVSGNLIAYISRYNNYSSWFSSKHTYDWDTKKNLTRLSYFVWSENKAQWISEYKVDFSYDENGNQTMQMQYDWDNNQNVWEAVSKTEFDFDLNYASADILFPEGGYGIFDEPNMLVKSRFYVWKASAWSQVEIDLFYYSGALTGVQTGNELKCKVFPTPAVDLVTIEVPSGEKQAELALYNMHGNKILEKQFASPGIISLADLAPGSYIYVVNAGKMHFRGKILKH